MDKKEKKERESLKMRLFFYYCNSHFDKVSEISGRKVNLDNNTLNYHHIFEKSTHPELAYCLDNIMVVTADEHANLNVNSNFYEKVVEKKEFINNNLQEMIKRSAIFEKQIETVVDELFNKKQI